MAEKGGFRSGFLKELGLSVGRWVVPSAFVVMVALAVAYVFRGCY